MRSDNYPKPNSPRSKTPKIQTIAKQEAIGLLFDHRLQLRADRHFDFLAGLDGAEEGMAEAQGIKFAGGTSKAEAPHVKGKLGSRHHPQITHFEFLKANTKRTPKMTIPKPVDAALSQRTENDR